VSLLRTSPTPTQPRRKRCRFGTPIRRDNLHNKNWKPLLRRAGLPDIRFHDLRHTRATLLLTKGVHPKIVSEMLGHSSIAITIDTYSHVIPGLGDFAASAMDAILNKTTGSKQQVASD
jgi:integrase